jgi:hypothetical protein
LRVEHRRCPVQAGETSLGAVAVRAIKGAWDQALSFAQ